MAHYGMLRDYRFSDAKVDDIRGADLYGRGDEKLGTIDDVIFNHATGAIQYAVVDTGGWLSSKKFIVLADRIIPRPNHPDDFFVDATKQQIEALPKFDGRAVEIDEKWAEHEKQHREAWGGPVLHKEGSTHSITPEPSELPAGSGSGVDDQAYMPDRIAGVFTETSPDPNKTRMRPSGLAARAEDSRLPGTFVPEDKPTLAEEEAEDRAAADPMQAQRDHLTTPDTVYVSERDRNARWSAFEDQLRRNRVDVTASCRSCGTARDKVA